MTKVEKTGWFGSRKITIEDVSFTGTCKVWYDDEGRQVVDDLLVGLLYTLWKKDKAYEDKLE